jgi:hypothetical protein
MNDVQKYPLMSIVKFDLIVKEFEAEFNHHFDDHIIELAHKEGYCRAWRTREARRSYNFGVLEQEFCQIYQVDAPERFTSWPGSSPPKPVTVDQPHRRDMTAWGRVYYRILLRKEKDERQGLYWGRYEFDFKGKASEREGLKRAVAAYARRVLEQPGVHRVWQLEYHPTKMQVDKDPVAKHMLVFEIDAPENIFDPSLGEDRIKWSGKAAGVAAPMVGRHFSHLLLTSMDLK